MKTNLQLKHTLCTNGLSGANDLTSRITWGLRDRPLSSFIEHDDVMSLIDWPELACTILGGGGTRRLEGLQPIQARRGRPVLF